MFVPIVPPSGQRSRPAGRSRGSRRSMANPGHSNVDRPTHREYRHRLRARDFRAPPADDGRRETARLIVTIIIVALWAFRFTL